MPYINTYVLTYDTTYDAILLKRVILRMQSATIR